MTAQVVPFIFQKQHSVRVTLIDGKPWFCLADVCAVLEIKNNRRVAAEMLDQKGVRKTYTQTQGGEQALIFINEPNLYRVIFRSNKPEAKAFQDWVFDEVLPAIREDGRYERPASKPGVPDARWLEILDLIHKISACCHFKGKAESALHERVRWIGGVPVSRLLPEDKFDGAKADLVALEVLARQILSQNVARDESFIETVLRPPVSIRKVRALVRRQTFQPGLI